MATTEQRLVHVIMPGDTAPLVPWTHRDGWREWAAA